MTRPINFALVTPDGAKLSCEINALSGPTLAPPHIENIGEFSQMSNPSEGVENENPGASGDAAGAVCETSCGKAASFKTDYYRNRAEAATALCHAIADCDPADACEIMEAAYGSLRAGMPIAPFDGIMEEAGFWADFATRQELKAYCLACFTRLSAADQAAFLGYVRGDA